MSTYSINLNTITWTATKALLDLDDSYIGTPNYMGITYFWHHEYRHYLRDASPSQRIRVHKKWLDADLDLDGITKKHWDIVGEVLKKDVRSDKGIEVFA
jgi:hypothetical protein|tara:strand:+ start:52 stop:348 length:297 start_codon:yes stop_codon:yes gene_type:complete